MPTITLQDIQQAAERLRDVAQLTPVLTSPELDERSGATVFLKCENFQRTGSFKFRGAYNAVSLLDASTAGRPVVTVSSGNHGQALALAARLHHRTAHVFAPGAMTERKRRAILSYGATVHEAPTRTAAEQGAQDLTAHGEAILIHPFNSREVIAGQGTCALELLDQRQDLDVLLAPVGGGGYCRVPAWRRMHCVPVLRCMRANRTERSMHSIRFESIASCRWPILGRWRTGCGRASGR